MNAEKRLSFMKKAAIGAAAATSAGVAGATGPIDTLLAGVDLSTVGTWVGTTGLVVVGIYLAFKGIDLAKRGISKA